MSLIQKMERKFGRFAIPNLYLWIIVCIVLSYVLYFAVPDVYDMLLFIPSRIAENHEYWRFFTWMFTIPYAPSAYNLIILPLNLYFYYWVGKRLEAVWGRFLFNLYFWSGVLLTQIFVAVFTAIFVKTGNTTPLDTKVRITRYMLISIFLAFSVIFQDQVVLLWFIIPLKMKYLGILDIILLALEFLQTGDFFTRGVILISIFTFYLYYFQTRGRYKNGRNRRPSGGMRRQQRQRRTPPPRNPDGTLQFPGSGTMQRNPYGNARNIRPEVTVHRCTICGRTEKSDPDLEFRFCTKCRGNHEYCMDHLYTHKHIT